MMSKESQNLPKATEMSRSFETLECRPKIFVTAVSASQGWANKMSQSLYTILWRSSKFPVPQRMASPITSMVAEKSQWFDETLPLMEIISLHLITIDN